MSVYTVVIKTKGKKDCHFRYVSETEVSEGVLLMRRKVENSEKYGYPVCEIINLNHIISASLFLQINNPKNNV